jgi:hypothetical protein
MPGASLGLGACQSGGKREAARCRAPARGQEPLTSAALRPCLKNASDARDRGSGPTSRGGSTGFVREGPVEGRLRGPREPRANREPCLLTTGCMRTAPGSATETPAARRA